jgi:hypothetical protein
MAQPATNSNKVEKVWKEHLNWSSDLDISSFKLDTNAIRNSTNM